MADSPEATGWRPIETAPRDETPILLASPSISIPLYGWWRNGAWRPEALMVVRDFSHWMPLPEPPA